MLYSATLWRNRNRSVLCLLSFLPYWFYFCFLGLLLTWGMAFIIKSVMTPIVSALIIGLLVRMYSTRARNKFPFLPDIGLFFRQQTTWKFFGKLGPVFFVIYTDTIFPKLFIYYEFSIIWCLFFTFGLESSFRRFDYKNTSKSHVFCWSFLFPERPIPDEINPLSRTQVPLLLLVYGVLSFHREVPKIKHSELAVF